MLKKTITYTDYNGVQRTEDFYFNISKAELLDMEMGVSGGYGEMLKRIVAAKDVPALISAFKDLIFKAYGEKSPDGKRFIKSEELSTAFSQTEAYTQLYMEFIQNDVAAAEFVNGVIPKELIDDPKVKALSNN